MPQPRSATVSVTASPGLRTEHQHRRTGRTGLGGVLHQIAEQGDPAAGRRVPRTVCAAAGVRRGDVRSGRVQPRQSAGSGTAVSSTPSLIQAQQGQQLAAQRAPRAAAPRARWLGGGPCAAVGVGLHGVEHVRIA